MSSSPLSPPLRRILIVTPHYPPRLLGGAGLRARNLANWLGSRGFSVEIVCVEEVSPGEDGGLAAQQDVFEDVPVHRLYSSYTRSLTAFRNAYDHPAIEAYLNQVTTEQRPDLIHLISGYNVTACAIRVARNRDIPVVVTLTDYWFICPRINLIRSNGQMCCGPQDALDCTRCLLGESRRYRLPEQFLPGVADRVWRVLSRFDIAPRWIPLYHQVLNREHCLIGLLNEADAVIIPTNSLRQRLIRAGVRDRFHLSRHSIVPGDLGVQPENSKTESSSFRFGYLGRVQFSKGIDLLVDAYRQLVADYEDISLTIWGDTGGQLGYVTRLKRLLKQTPRATMHGRYEPTRLGELLQSIDILVVPSRWPEIGPFVILEAFATQTPVIAARIGNMPELVQHDVNGLLFEPDSVSDLRVQMRRVLDEPELYNRLRAGIPPARTQKDEMSEIIEIYSQAMQQVFSRPDKQ